MIERPSITAIYEHYGLKIVGRGSGDWTKAECPKLDHEDMNPSATINEDLGKWRCWACDGHGDGLDIIMERENLARIADAQQWAAQHLAGSSRAVRPQRRSRSGLSVRPAPGARARNWSPPWSGL